MKFWVLSALVAVASSAQIPTYTNGAARAAQLIAGKGASPVAVSDLAIHPVNYWNAGLEAAGLSYELVGHNNGAVVPAEPIVQPLSHFAVIQAVEDAEAEALAIQLAAVQAKKDAVASVHAAHLAKIQAKKDAKARERAAQLAAIQAKKDAEARELASHLAKFQAIKNAHDGARAAHFAAVKAAKARNNPSFGAIKSTEPIGVTYNNGASRAAHLVSGKGALPVGVSDLAIHPVNYWNAGLQAAGVSYDLVGHNNGAVVPAEPIVQPLSHFAVIQAVEDAEAEALAIQLAAVQAKKDAVASVHAAHLAGIQAEKDADASELAAQLAAIQAKKDAEARELASHLAKFQAIKSAHDGARAAHFAAVKAAGGATH